MWYKYINMQHNTLYNIRPIEKSRNTLMYVTRYAWEMGGALVSVVVATPVNKNNLLLQTRVHTILLQTPSPPPEKEEEKRKKEEEEKLKL